MVEKGKEEWLDFTEVQEITRKFIWGLYPNSEIFFSGAKLADVSKMTVYEVKGKLIMRQSDIAKPVEKKFTIHVHPIQGKILGYKM